MEDERFWNLVINLTLVKFCYDYDTEQAKRFLSHLSISEDYPDWLLDYCFNVIAPGTRIYYNEHIKNKYYPGNDVKVVIFKHPIIEKIYGLSAKIKTLNRKKYYRILKDAINEAEDYMQRVINCYNGSSYSCLKNKHGIINRYRLELNSDCIDYYDSVLYLMANYIETLKHAYKEVSDMLYDKGVDVC